jgi:uncharacterized surface protein with fasciclin (FAS1) repeats
MNNSQNNSPTLDLIDTAAANGTLKTFGRAVQLAGMEETLRAAGPYTLFAPTDTAFEQLPPGKLNSLFEPANKSELISVLNYHMLKGRRSVTDVGNWKAANTVNGQQAPIAKTEGKVSIDGARITDADIQTSNGVIHAIDKVNMPKPTKN